MYLLLEKYILIMIRFGLTVRWGVCLLVGYSTKNEWKVPCGLGFPWCIWVFWSFLCCCFPKQWPEDSCFFLPFYSHKSASYVLMTGSLLFCQWSSLKLFCWTDGTKSHGESSSISSNILKLDFYNLPHFPIFYFIYNYFFISFQIVLKMV